MYNEIKNSDFVYTQIFDSIIVMKKLITQTYMAATETISRIQ